MTFMMQTSLFLFTCGGLQSLPFRAMLEAFSLISITPLYCGYVVSSCQN